MKRIVYMYNIPVNRGDEENPVMEDCLYQKSLPYSAQAEEIAKNEAYNGEYTIEDDGQAETAPAPTLETRVTTLEESSAEMTEALDMILSGVTEDE